MERKVIASATVTVEQFDDGSIKSSMSFTPDLNLDYKSHRQIVNAGNKIFGINNTTDQAPETLQ